MLHASSVTIQEGEGPRCWCQVWLLACCLAGMVLAAGCETGDLYSTKTEVAQGVRGHAAHANSVGGQRPQMTVVEAKQALRDALESVRCAGMDGPLQNIEVRLDGFKYLEKGESVRLIGDPVPYAYTVSFKFSEIHTIEARRVMGSTYVAVNGKVDFPIGGGLLSQFGLPPEKAQRFVEAVQALKYYSSKQGLGNDQAVLAGFREQAEAWRALPQKPAIPEAARRFEVLAKDAFQSREFDQAVDYYERGLEICPLWPEAQYNTALICGETGLYAQAAGHMKRYLALCPYAKDAQAAKDQVYVWEEKARRVPGSATGNRAPAEPARGRGLF
jgi:tetratricopeptide (TPR) repeat protein